jgi:5-methylcytosine-specific restriction endonuclease McrA
MRMGRLKTAPSRLAFAPGRLAAPIDTPSRDKERNAFNPLRALYKTTRWVKLRWATLVRDGFTCQMCGRLEGDTSKLVADHRRPHRGDEALFWDADNLWTLCASPCHAKHKQREEQAAEFR